MSSSTESRYCFPVPPHISQPAPRHALHAQWVWGIPRWYLKYLPYRKTGRICTSMVLSEMFKTAIRSGFFVSPTRSDLAATSFPTSRLISDLSGSGSESPRSLHTISSDSLIRGGTFDPITNVLPLIPENARITLSAHASVVLKKSPHIQHGPSWPLYGLFRVSAAAIRIPFPLMSFDRP
ncbi:MAG: hypothetical protein BWY05_01145 [Euryarchaeota archaeon ADurb.Bin165]|nr:MAG: hypothetical protein BWY05_01145 [Euryarchaeota archaeon ADurb.Bin165]